MYITNEINSNKRKHLLLLFGMFIHRLLDYKEAWLT